MRVDSRNNLVTISLLPPALNPISVVKTNAAKMVFTYKRCRTAELERFVRQRRLQVELRRGQERGCYMRALLDADQEATFRFFDLPPELRNRVYETLLALQDTDHGWKCWPEILATCRQAHREGHSILYEDNHSIVNMCMSLGDFGDDTKLEAEVEVWVNGQSLKLQDWSIFEAPFCWPSILRASRRVEVVICFDLGGRRLFAPRWFEATAPVLNKTLFDLYFFLLKRKDGLQVDFRIHLGSPVMAPDTMRLVLSPLALFDGHKRLELKHIKRRFRHAVEAVSFPNPLKLKLPGEGFLERCRHLLKEGQEMKEFLMSFWRLPDMDSAHRFVLTFERVNGMLRRDVSIDAMNVGPLEAMLDELEEVLDDMDLGRIEMQLAEMMNTCSTLAHSKAKRATAERDPV